jgi:glycosyltransferase involved in cell wall biosynthesis
MRIAVLSLADPDGPPHGGAIRIRALATALERAGHDVDRVFPATAATSAVAGSRGIGPSRGERQLPQPLRRLKRHLLPMPTQLGARNAAMAHRLADLAPDVLLMTAVSQASYRAAVPQARLWVDLLDVWSAFALREARARSGLSALTSRAQVAQLRRVEDRLAREAAVVTVVGWRDREIMLTRGADVTWLPVTLPEASFRQEPTDRPRVAGLLGNFHFWPNRDAYDRLVATWAPRLVAAGWEVVVAGLGATSLPQSSLVRNLGQLADPTSFYRDVGLVVAPIALGGGMKVKVVEALAHGRPVLASPEAAEGLPPDVRAMVTVTPLDAPVPADVAQAAPADRLERLAPFRTAFLEATVHELMARLG